MNNELAAQSENLDFFVDSCFSRRSIVLLHSC